MLGSTNSSSTFMRKRGRHQQQQQQHDPHHHDDEVESILVAATTSTSEDDTVGMVDVNIMADNEKHGVSSPLHALIMTQRPFINCHLKRCCPPSKKRRKKLSLLLVFLLTMTYSAYRQNIGGLKTILFMINGFLHFYDEDDTDWVLPFLELHAKNAQSKFEFSMSNTPECDLMFNNKQSQQQFQQAMKTAVHDWDQRQRTKAMGGNTVSISQEMKEAEDVWYHAIKSCHPNAPTSLQSKLTLRKFMDGTAKCADADDSQHGGHPNLFDGEFCIRAAHIWSRLAFEFPTLMRFLLIFGHSPFIDPRQTLLANNAQCALQLEFPLRPLLLEGDGEKDEHGISDIENQQTFTTTVRQRKPPGWKPTKVILLTLTMGPTGVSMGCKLLASAFPRSWELVFVTGQFRSFVHKFGDTLDALRIFFKHHKDINPHDTLVVFADSTDVVAQRSPQDVVELYLNQPYEFLFSAETSCFPMAVFPHSLGLPRHVCDQLYPVPSGANHRPSLLRNQKFVNTGGWIGTGSSALVVLKELIDAVKTKDLNGNYKAGLQCKLSGTDQLYGNAAFLRSPHIGLDVDYTFFASNAVHLLNRKILTVGPVMSVGNATATTANIQKAKPNQGWCYYPEKKDDIDPGFCPSFTHFNGGGSKAKELLQAFAAVTSREAVPECHYGTVSVVDRVRGQLKVYSRHDVLAGDYYDTWGQCLRDNACF